jgi:hypothetical protein
MGLRLVLYLFFISVFLTMTLSVILKNRGPWDNPMLFFLVLFLTSWTILLWFGNVTIRSIEYPFISVTAITILIAVLLAAARTSRATRNKVRRIRDSKQVEVVTRMEDNQRWMFPNFYYWGLILFESLLIIGAYSREYFEMAGK